MSDGIPAVETCLPAQPRSWLRRLRIAVSVFFGLLTVALLVLWGLSKWQRYQLTIPVSQFGIAIAAADGLFGVFAREPSLRFHIAPLSESDKKNLAAIYPLGLGREVRSGNVGVHFPIWLPMLLTSFSAVAARSTNLAVRFSLRTLLIAATLVAIVLGLAAWLACSA